MDGFGPEKLIFILLVVMLIFGAKRLPEIGSGLGRGIREFKKSVRGDLDEAAPQPPQGYPTQMYQAPVQPQMYQAPVAQQQLPAAAPVAQQAPAQTEPTQA